MGISEGLLIPLVKNYLTPICAALFPCWGGSSIDSFKGFIVTYQIDSETSLADHYDNAEITINISLTDTFDAGEISFGPMHGEEISDNKDRIQESSDDDDFDFDSETKTRIVMPHKVNIS